MRRASVLLALGLLILAAPLALAVQIQVEGLQDSLAGPPAINHCTLRKAIVNANNDAATFPQCQAGSGVDEIVFNLPGTVTFALAGIMEDGALTGDLDITESVIITGHPDGTVIDGADLDRIFDVNPSGAGVGVVLTLSDIHLRNGTGLGSAGAISSNNATLNLDRITISACNVNGGDGGAIYSLSSTLNLTSSTISGNVAAHHGGAIVVDGGAAVITSSTITGNASGFSNLTGGIRNTGTTTLRNTIVAGNLGTDLPNLDGTFTSLGYNIIGDLGPSIGNPTIVPAIGDQIEVADASVNLGPLQNNGGPTPTHALLAGSIALDKGHSSGATTDQRGLVRPCDDAGIANAAGGDGADAGAYEEQVACVSNAAPDAVDDAATIAEDSGANAIGVLANDTDTNGDTLTIISVTQGSNGSVTFTSANVSYTPAPNFFGSDSFTYTIGDGEGEMDTATVSVTVTNVNDAPVAVAEAYSMNQDTTLLVPLPGVLGNDSDIDGDTLTAVLGTDVSHGTLALGADGSFDYQPDPSFAGTDSFTYTAHDAATGSNTVTVTINIADTQPPSITAAVATAQLWPPNHDLENVGLTYSATDNSSAVTTTLAVFSDEDDLAPASGNHSPDASGTLRLRAERSANGDGRVYLILITATDAFANASKSCLTVVVPKSMSAAHQTAVAQQAAAAQAQCTGAGLFVVGDGPVVGPKQ